MNVRSARILLVLGALLAAGSAMALAPAPTPPAAALPESAAPDCEPDVPLATLMAPELVSPGEADTHACVGGIQPGAWMRSPAWCTMNWIFSDTQGNTYIGTAGHCVSSVGQRVSIQGVGDMGTVRYRVAGGPGNDFALVQVDADKLHLVDATLCHWGGPTAMLGAGSFEDMLMHYGWGANLYYATSATRPRVADYTSMTADRLNYRGFTNGGDSGSPVMSADGTALGVHTHRTGGIGVPAPVGYGDKFGTRVDVGVARASAALGTTITLVPGSTGPSLLGTSPV